VKKRFRSALADRGLPPEELTDIDGWPAAEGFQIGNLQLANRVVQAPLAGIGNWAFRLQSTRHGAGLCISEMVSSWGVRHANERTTRMLRIDPREGPMGIQLFGTNPEVMAEAARAVEEAGADLVDINMGCPVPKICKTGAGAALLADLDAACAVVRAMTDAVDIPVTVKMRRGVTPRDSRPTEAAQRFADAGAAAIGFHPRAAAEEYDGAADHAITAEVVAAVDIPVIASGDIITPRQARDVLESTGCAAVMIGRAALGNPWVLDAMATGMPSTRPRLAGVVEEAIAFAEDIRLALGDAHAGPYMRKFYSWYLAGEPVTTEQLQQMLTAPTLDEALDLLRAAVAAESLESTRGLN
jgi:tRNA-dihydrouridine synthase B